MRTLASLLTLVALFACQGTRAQGEPAIVPNAQPVGPQKPVQQYYVEDGGAHGEVLESIVIPPKLNAPFTLLLQTEWVRGLPDGGSIATVNERRIARDAEGRIYTPDQRLAMLPLCDYVVVAAPLNAETVGLLGAAEFAAMKPSAVIINVGRGPVINEQAMINALSHNKIKGAALDVFDEEPLPADHPFYKLENVLLSPHCADHTPDWLDNAMRFFLAQFKKFRHGEPLLNVVDKKLGY